MLLRLLITTLVLFPICKCYGGEDDQSAQEKTLRKQADSILSLIHAPGAATSYENLKALSNVYMQLSKGDSAMIWAMKAKIYSQGQKDIEQEIGALQLAGTIQEVNFKNYKAALELYISAANTAREHNLLARIHQVYINILNLYFYLGDFVNAMRYATDGLHRAEDSNDEELTAHYQSLIGFIHLRQNNAAVAEKYYRQFLQYAISVKDTSKIADAYTSLAECDINAKKFNNALGHIQTSIEIYWQLYANKKLAKVDRIPYALFRMGYCYGSQGRFNEAKTYVLRALYYTKVFPCNLYDIAQYKIYAGNIFLKTGAVGEALKSLREGLHLAKSIDHKENIRDAFFYLQELFAGRKQFDSAYYYNILYTGLKDAIANEKSTREIEQIAATYALEKKDNEIKLLEQGKRLQEARSKRQLLWRNLLIVITVLIMILIVFLLNRNYLRRKNRMQQEINARQNEIFNISATVQDHERKRIAKDLHDGMGTLLSAAKLKLSALHDQQLPVKETIVLLDDAIVELRDISHNLMPAPLSRLGLVAALENLFEKIRNLAELNIHLVVHGFSERISEEKEMVIYRVVLELVNNVVKHANASELTVQLIKYPGELMLTVEDNGSGFSEDALYKNGIGLTNIRSRIAYLEGDIRIDTSTQAGTTVIVDIPV